MKKRGEKIEKIKKREYNSILYRCAAGGVSKVIIILGVRSVSSFLKIAEFSRNSYFPAPLNS